MTIPKELPNLPESLYEDYAPRVEAGSSSQANPAVHDHEGQRRSIIDWIQALQFTETQELALHSLFKTMRNGNNELLAPLLWNSFCTVRIIIQEIVSVYRLLSSVNLTQRESTRACNAISLLQCLAYHPETKTRFLNAQLPTYLYPFLRDRSTERPNEYLRITALGVLGALVKVDDGKAIYFLLQSEVVPCCLNSMEVGNELSKTAATFIIYKILMNDKGLNYCCVLSRRFCELSRVLRVMIESRELSSRLLKNIILCYLRLTDNPRARMALSTSLPTTRLGDFFFINRFLQGDSTIGESLRRLFYIVKEKMSKS